MKASGIKIDRETQSSWQMPTPGQAPKGVKKGSKVDNKKSKLPKSLYEFMDDDMTNPIRQ